MKKIMDAEGKDTSRIRSSLQAGFGLKYPEKIHGYAGFFFNYGDIYASDSVYIRMNASESFKAAVLGMLQRFRNDDYGVISQRDYWANIEDRHLSGGGCLLSRYAYGDCREINGRNMPEDYIVIRHRSPNTSKGY